MQLVWHYLNMYAKLKEKVEADAQPVEIGLRELAGMLYCSERNVKLLVRKMTEAGWILWNPGKGRGHTSRLTFLLPIEQVVLQEAKAIAEKGRLAEALEMMRTEELGQAQRERFLRFVSGYFGHQVVREEDREMDVLRLPIYKSLTVLDPAFVFYAIDCFVADHLFDPLLRMENGKAKPHIAYAWESDAEGSAWRLRLRKGVRFHQGEELTAEHVRHSFERLRRIGSPHRWMVEGILDIAVEGRYRIGFELASPNVLFPEFLCNTGLSVVLEEGGELSGTGPFRLVKRQGRLLRLEANTDYFLARAHLDRVDLWFLPESIEPPVSLEADAPLFFNHRAPIADPGEDELRIQTVELGVSLLTCNTRKRGPLRDRRLREAVDLGLDRRRMANELGENRLGPAFGFIQSRADDDRRGRKEDDKSCVERARRLVAESGYRGELLKLYVYPKHAADACWVRDRCAEIGIRIEVSVYSEADMASAERIAEADFILYEAVGNDGDETTAVEFFGMPDSYLGSHADEAVGEWLDSAVRRVLAEPDPAARRALLARMEDKLREDRQVLFLLRKSLSMAHNPAVKGASFNALGWADLHAIWFE